MPPAITASPHLVTPSRAYCTAPTSSSPQPSPSRARMWPRRKNSHQNGLCSKFSYVTGCWRFGLRGKTGRIAAKHARNGPTGHMKSHQEERMVDVLGPPRHVRHDEGGL